MIEHRKLTREEFNQLFLEAEESETEAVRMIKYSPFDYFNDKSIETSGIIINGRPIYFWAIILDKGKHIIWTIANRKIKHQKTLYKLSKQDVLSMAKKYGVLFATMRKSLNKNVFWTKKMGFIPKLENKEFIMLELKGNN